MHIPQNFLPRSRQKLLRSAPGQSFPAVAVMPHAAKVLKQVMVNTGGNKRQGNDSNLLIVFYVQIMPDDFVMQLHRF
ncbi:hypothetical protein [Escherichia coli]|uniref:hypothetical protein n=1 Tax=Escherichia coli TaxID=562 RepID=UPI00339D399F